MQPDRGSPAGDGFEDAWWQTLPSEGRQRLPSWPWLPCLVIRRTQSDASLVESTPGRRRVDVRSLASRRPHLPFVRPMIDLVRRCHCCGEVDRVAGARGPLVGAERGLEARAVATQVGTPVGKVLDEVPRLDIDRYGDLVRLGNGSSVPPHARQIRSASSRLHAVWRALSPGRSRGHGRCARSGGGVRPGLARPPTHSGAEPLGTSATGSHRPLPPLPLLPPFFLASSLASGAAMRPTHARAPLRAPLPALECDHRRLEPRQIVLIVKEVQHDGAWPPQDRAV